MTEHSPLTDDLFDVAVIGAGVVGCALTRAFAMAGARAILLEKAHDILDGASKANSAILHTGFDAPVGSLEAACVAAGHAEYLDIHDRLGLPVMKTGALVIAWTEDEEAALPALMEQARQNGVNDVHFLDRTALREAEPGLGPAARAAFRVPREYLIDPWAAPLAYLTQAMLHGATLRRNCPVTEGAFDGAIWRLTTPQGTVRTKAVINAAGASTLHELYTRRGLRWGGGKADLAPACHYYDELDRLEKRADTIASAIEINRPVNLNKCLRALEACDGVVREVTEQEILDAKAQVGAGGLGCEPASAASVAGAKQLVAEGVIGKDDRVVCILTGHQLKDPNATVAYHTTDQALFNEVLGSRGVSRASFANRSVSVGNRLDEIIQAIDLYG